VDKWGLKGSAGELKYYLLLSRDLSYLLEEKYLSLKAEVEEISKMLNGLIKSLSYTHTNTYTFVFFLTLSLTLTLTLTLTLIYD